MYINGWLLTNMKLSLNKSTSEWLCTYLNMIHPCKYVSSKDCLRNSAYAQVRCLVYLEHWFLSWSTAKMSILRFSMAAFLMFIIVVHSYGMSDISEVAFTSDWDSRSSSGGELVCPLCFGNVLSRWTLELLHAVLTPDPWWNERRKASGAGGGFAPRNRKEIKGQGEKDEFEWVFN